MSACDAFRGLLSAHLDGALEPADRLRLEAHLEGCAACRRDLEDLRATVEGIRSLEPVEPPPWLEERILERIRSRPRPLAARITALARRPSLQAACVLLVCTAGYLALRISGTLRGPELPPAPGPGPAAPQAAPAPSAEPPPSAPGAARPQAQPPRPRLGSGSSGFAPPPPAPEAPGAALQEAAPRLRDLQRPSVAGDLATSGASGPTASGDQNAAPSVRALAAPSRAAAPETARKAAPNAETLVFRLAPRDPEGVLVRVEALCRRAGARFQAPDPGASALAARVAARNLRGLLESLEALGTLEGPRPDPAALGEGDVAVLITW